MPRQKSLENYKYTNGISNQVKKLHDVIQLPVGFLALINYIGPS